MRREFSDLLEKEMENNKDIFFLCGDLGYKNYDNIRDKFPDRFINTGAAEQSLADLAVGLAYAGKIPFVYSITSFLIYRAFETLRTYINHEKLNVKLIGGGRDKDYEVDGISHFSDDAQSVLNTLPNIVQYWPETKEELPDILTNVLSHIGPDFISLRR